MARDLMDDTYYKSTGGQVPVKWTAPEVSNSRSSRPELANHSLICTLIITFLRVQL